MEKIERGGPINFILSYLCVCVCVCVVGEGDNCFYQSCENVASAYI